MTNKGRTSPFRGEGGKIWNPRISPVVAHSGDCLLSEPTAGTQPCRQEPLFMPHSGRSLTQPDSGADEGKRTFGSRRQMTPNCTGAVRFGSRRHPDPANVGNGDVMDHHGPEHCSDHPGDATTVVSLKCNEIISSRALAMLSLRTGSLVGSIACCRFTECGLQTSLMKDRCVSAGTIQASGMMGRSNWPTLPWYGNVLRHVASRNSSHAPSPE
jgi:hypothetical protein